MTHRALWIWVSCIAGLAITSFSIAQAPPVEDTRSEAEWGQFLAKNPEVMGVHLARLERTIEELRGRIDELEKRKSPQITSAKLPFSFRDEKGKVRFLLSAASDGDGDGAVMMMTDGNGKPRIGLAAFEDSGLFQIYDVSGQVVARLSSKDYSGSLVVNHSDGRSVEVDGGRGVNVRGVKGDPLAALYSDGKAGWVNVYGGAQGFAVVQMHSISTGAGRLTISDEQGRFLLDAGMATDGSGILKMGPHGNGAAGVITGGKAASSLQGRTD